MKNENPGSAEPLLGPVRENAEQGLGAPREDVHRGWYSGGHLPHADFPGVLQFITYRLADSLPAAAVDRAREEFASLPEDERSVEHRRRMEALIDQGHGCCALNRPEVAGCVVETWKLFAPERYDLIAWVVMPNHVHVLIRVREGWSLGKIMQSWKSYTGKRIKAEHGVGWFRDYWDRFIRDENHFSSTVRYIHENPVKAGLADCAENWPWSSVHEYPGSAEPLLGPLDKDAEQGLGAPRKSS